MTIVDKAMAGRLRFARKLAGIQTGKAAAEALRLPYPTYLAHENGTGGFLCSAPRYATFYKVDLRWLMSGVGSPKSRSIEANIMTLPKEQQKAGARFH